MKTISVTTVITAPIEVVWHHLVATDAFPTWNPFITHLTGPLEVGARLQVTIVPPGGRAMSFRPTVTAVEEGGCLEWLGRLGIPGIFDGRHRFSLEKLDQDTTRFTHEEAFTGVLVPVTGAMLARTRAGFAAMNDALRRRAEADVAPRGRTR